MDFYELISGTELLGEAKEIRVSSRFQENGKEILWKIRPISAKRWREIKKEEDHWSAFIVACVQYPNLEDPALQESYGAKNGTDLVKKMLYAGEYLRLLEQVKALNGFEKRKEALYITAKN